MTYALRKSFYPPSVVEHTVGHVGTIWMAAKHDPGIIRFIEVLCLTHDPVHLTYINTGATFLRDEMATCQSTSLTSSEAPLLHWKLALRAPVRRFIVPPPLVDGPAHSDAREADGEQDDSGKEPLFHNVALSASHYSPERSKENA